jgi:hypothetical protein
VLLVGGGADARMHDVNVNGRLEQTVHQSARAGLRSRPVRFSPAREVGG